MPLAPGNLCFRLYIAEADTGEAFTRKVLLQCEWITEKVREFDYNPYVAIVPHPNIRVAYSRGMWWVLVWYRQVTASRTPHEHLISEVFGELDIEVNPVAEDNTASKSHEHAEVLHPTLVAKEDRFSWTAE